MPKIPSGHLLLKGSVLTFVVLAAVWTSYHYSEKKRLIGNLEAHAHEHPEDADVVRLLVECNSAFIVDVEACGAALIAYLGPEQAMLRMEKLGREGAFGRPINTGEPQ